MQTLRDGVHDPLLHVLPLVHDLGVPDSDDVIAHQHELRVVIDVGSPLCADVMRAIDLNHETLADQHIDAVTRDSDLQADGEMQPPQPNDEDGLEPGVGPR